MLALNQIKATTKRIVYGFGGLAGYRRIRPGTLTSILFHRVLPPDDPRAKTADPDYTMRLETFEKCLDAMRQWYQPIALEDVENALHRRTKLPRNALLVTFDDGWEDTARYAVPALRARDMPGLIFVTTGAIGKENVPWRDVAACAWRAGTLTAPKNRAEVSDSLDALLIWLGSLPTEERTNILAVAIEAAGPSVRPLMMSPQTLRQLADEGIGLGGHGISHIPMTALTDADQELRDCRTEFERLTGRVATSFAFPHGLYSQPTIDAARRAGFELIFTSDWHLNPLPQGQPNSSIFGRVAMAEDYVTDSDGRFCPEKLAYFLTLQPVAQVA